MSVRIYFLFYFRFLLRCRFAIILIFIIFSRHNEPSFSFTLLKGRASSDCRSTHRRRPFLETSRKCFFLLFYSLSFSVHFVFSFSHDPLFLSIESLTAGNGAANRGSGSRKTSYIVRTYSLSAIASKKGKRQPEF